MATKTKTYKVNPKKMSSEVYKLRQAVMGYIREAKALVPELPRIEVRIVDNHAEIAGMAKLGTNQIFITEGFVASRGLIFHEILHAVYSIDHITGCPLMWGNGYSINLAKDLCEQLFVYYAKNARFHQYKSST